MPRIKPVYKEVLADLETPLDGVSQSCRTPEFSLGESVEQGERVARYSFIGTGERRRIEARGSTVQISTPEGAESFESTDPLRVLWDLTVRDAELEPNLPDFWAGSVGYAAYDLIRQYESLPDANPDELGVPDLLLYRTRSADYL